MRKVFFLFFFLMALGSWASAQQKLVFLAPDYPPYTETKSGKVTGTGVTFMEALGKKLGIAIEIRGVPNYGAALEGVKNGQADGFFLASKNAERDAVGIFSQSVTTSVWTWILLKSSPLDPKSADFKAKAKVGSQLGSNTTKWAKDNGYNITATPGDVELLIKILEGGRVDAIFTSELVFDAMLKKSGSNPGNFKKTVQEAKPFGVYLSKATAAKYPDLMNKINAEIPKLRF